LWIFAVSLAAETNLFAPIRTDRLRLFAPQLGFGVLSKAP